MKEVTTTIASSFFKMTYRPRDTSDTGNKRRSSADIATCVQAKEGASGLHLPCHNIFQHPATTLRDLHYTNAFPAVPQLNVLLITPSQRLQGIQHLTPRYDRPCIIHHSSRMKAATSTLHIPTKRRVNDFNDQPQKPYRLFHHVLGEYMQ